MADEVFLTPEERLAELSDKLICSSIGSDDLAKTNRKILFGQVSPKVFKNENYIIFKVLFNFKDKGITPDEDFIRMYLLRNKKMVKESQSYIDINAYKDLDEDPVVGYISAVLKQFTRLRGMDELSEDDFKLVLEKYKLEYSNFEMNIVYSQARMILYDGLQEGRRFYQGYSDSVAYVKRKIADIESLLDHTTGAGFIDSSVQGLVDDEDVEPTKIGDFGLIKELNEHLGGIYTSYFYSILAPTKGGKSKFTSALFHNILVEYGNNVVVWAHEGGYSAWWAQLRAIHYNYLYIRNGQPENRPEAVSQQDIISKTYPSESIRSLEEASRLDLFTNPNYGNLYMIDRPFNVETFIEEIETAVQLNNAKAVLIDYLQLIDWTSSGISKPQAISQAYQKLLAYAKKRNVAVFSPAQFTQGFMDEMAKSKDGAQHEVRTAGGESSEIIRTPDINIALYASIEDLIRNEMTILSVPSRLASPFPSFGIYCDLKSCVFSSIDEE